MMFGPYPGVVRDWHDGDTCHVDLDLGFGILLNSHDLDGHPVVSLRVYGINAPELGTPTGREALAYALTVCPPGTRVIVVSHGWDKYGGRFDGSIALPDGSDFATLMLNSGNAVPFA